ncbi:MAG: hypothetical protein USCGTAYLOR_00168 [Chromatiales bacterium USCg_Taylor]|nr:MAG: hypothetical protein USCGTAYLOR_00168 [Chromatiales bacterium USCg_Taylor]
MLITYFLHRLLIEVRSHDLLGNPVVIGGTVHHAPAAVLAQEPLCVFRLWIVTVTIAEDHVVGIFRFAAVAEIVMSLQAAQDDVRRTINVSSLGDDLGLLGAVFHLIQPYAGLVQGFQDSLHGPWILIRKFRGEGAHLFRMILPNILGVDRRKPDSFDDGARVPRLPDTITVHLPHIHVGYHLRRRNGDEGNVLVRVDAARAEVIAHPHGVRPGRKGHREGHRFARFLCIINQRFKGFGIGRHFAFQVGFQGDGLAVAVEDPGGDHGFFWRTKEAHR